MNRRAMLILIALAPSLLTAQQAKTPQPAHDASLADTLKYLRDVLDNREDIFYVTQSDPAEPHFVSWEGDSLSGVHTDGYVLKHDRAGKFEDAQGPDVSFTPQYASHLPDNIVPRTASEDRFQVDLRNVQSVKVESLETYLRRGAPDYSYNAHIHILPRLFAVIAVAGDHPFSVTRLYPSSGPSRRGPIRPMPPRPASRSNQAAISDNDTNVVTYVFKTETAANDFAAALRHASALAHAEAGQQPPPRAPDASYADTLEYLHDILASREDITYLSQDSPAKRHAVTWNLDSVFDINAGGYSLDYARQEGAFDVEGPSVSFTSRYASHPPEGLDFRHAIIDHFYVDLRNVRSVSVEDLQSYIRRASEEDASKVHLRVLPKVFAVVVTADSKPFGVERRFPRTPRISQPIHRPPHAGRLGNNVPPPEFHRGDTDFVTFLFKSESAANNFASAIRHASDLACSESKQPQPQPLLPQ